MCVQKKEISFQKMKNVAMCAVMGAPPPEYTVSGGYRSSAAGGSTQRAVLALDCCLHDVLLLY